MKGGMKDEREREGIEKIKRPKIFSKSNEEEERDL
jgi:hypothetical protein